MPDVPAEFTGEVSGFTDDSPEAINAEGAQVEREASEAQPRVDEEAEAEAVIEPSSETLAELPVVAVQANQAEILAEESEGVLESGVVGEETVSTDVEPQGTVPQAGVPSSEVEVEVPVVPACEAQAPETSGEASVGGDLLISQQCREREIQSEMKIQCDVCEKQEAAVFCAADEAAICDGCDYRVHHANNLASKHRRFSLLHHPFFEEAPQCDICQERRALSFCLEDRAILCTECDVSIHTANEHTRKHSRFLLTGVKLSASSALYPTSANCDREIMISEPSTIEVSNPEMFSRPSISNSVTTPSLNYQISEESSISTSCVPEFLMEIPPAGWRFEDILDYSSSASDPLRKTFDYVMPIINQQGESNARSSPHKQATRISAPQGQVLPSDLPHFFPTTLL
ncbi:hypothetical protein Nepgr_020006 [Nepenthes gracilis]|uniref:B box-type domain-containing protein n=1 Tax=Nepenthes gracilis TaxID=150966 RepID=A0AAD3XVR4_NEPGR|nr:hypothetical protein Nepgr_020006 [Nepenthes gracilis]